MKLSPSFGVTIPESVLFRELGEESVLLELDSGRYYGLNQVGTRMWRLLADHGRLEPVCQILVQEYDVLPERAESDLVNLVQVLVSRGLLRSHE